MTGRAAVLAGLVLIAPAAPANAQAGGERYFLSVIGAYQALGGDFTSSRTVREHQEDGTVAADYAVSGGPLVEGSAGVRLWRWLGAGVGVSWTSTSTPSTVQGAIPHPFFFDMPRAVTAETGDLTREELAVHVRLRALVLSSPRLILNVFGGPSVIRTRQDVVAGVVYSEAYPFDEVTFVGVQAAAVRKVAAGFNAGADAVYFFTPRLGVEVDAQFTRAYPSWPDSSGLDAARPGGLRVGGGVHFKF